MNKHCDFVSIDVAYDLMDKLKITSKEEFAKLCGLTNKSQFYRWEKKGRMPQYRLSKLRETIHIQAKDKYDSIIKALYE